jgi:hypothetical protein
MEDRILFALVALVVGMGIFAATAQAETYISPEKAALLQQRGWTATDDDAQVPVVEEAAAGYAWCESRRKGTAVRYGPGDIAVRGHGKLTVCAQGGKIVFYRASYKHASPSEHWDHVFGPYVSKWTLDNREAAGLRVRQGWNFNANWFDEAWTLEVKLTARVYGKHDIRWPVKYRRWS